MLQIFLNSKNIYASQTSFSQLQENARFLNAYISRIIRLAGYRTPPISGKFIDVNTLFSSATPYVTGTQSSGLNSSDTLTLRYQGSGNGTGTPDGSIRDCLNNPIDANTIATSTFSLTANNELQCQAINPNATPSNNTQILISGVESFQVLFGEDLNADSTPDRYVNANFPGLHMNRVVSVRIGFILRSDNPIKMTTSNITYSLLGQSFTPANNKYLRIPLTFTVLLRNLTSEV